MKPPTKLDSVLPYVGAFGFLACAVAAILLWVQGEVAAVARQTICNLIGVQTFRIAAWAVILTGSSIFLAVLHHAARPADRKWENYQFLYPVIAWASILSYVFWLNWLGAQPAWGFPLGPAIEGALWLLIPCFGRLLELGFSTYARGSETKEEESGHDGAWAWWQTTFTAIAVIVLVGFYWKF
jgi:hypothetical protein